MNVGAIGAVGTPDRGDIGPLAFPHLGLLRGHPPSRGALGLLAPGPGVETMPVVSGHHRSGHPGFTSGRFAEAAASDLDAGRNIAATSLAIHAG